MLARTLTLTALVLCGASGAACGDDDDAADAGAPVDSGQDASAPERDAALDASEDANPCPVGTEGCLCDVGAACDEGLDCDEGGICRSPDPCVPLDPEPHADEETAVTLDPVTCGASSARPGAGTVEGPETDWFRFLGTEAFACPEAPSATVVGIDTLEVCVFAECLDGDLVGLQCARGSAQQVSPAGRQGCCAEGTVTISTYDCVGGPGVTKDVDAWISVGSAEPVCEDYDLSYGL